MTDTSSTAKPSFQDMLSAGWGLYAVMTLHEGRETEMFHLSGDVFRKQWDRALADWRKATANIVTGQ